MVSFSYYQVHWCTEMTVFILFYWWLSIARSYRVSLSSSQMARNCLLIRKYHIRSSFGSRIFRSTFWKCQARMKSFVFWYCLSRPRFVRYSWASGVMRTSRIRIILEVYECTFRKFLGFSIYFSCLGWEGIDSRISELDRFLISDDHSIALPMLRDNDRFTRYRVHELSEVILSLYGGDSSHMSEVKISLYYR